jgi:nucleoid DNA-binding protein
MEAKARLVRNIQSGDMMMVPKRRRVKFTPFNAFKSAANDKKE